MKYLQLINLIKEQFPHEAIEISECLGLLDDAINSLMVSIKESSSEAFTKKDFDKIKDLADLATQINVVQDEIKKYADSLEPDNVESSEEDEEKTIRSLPNYNNYLVDSQVPHTLYEDFTHKRPASFSIENNVFKVKTWQEVYLTTCELLFKRDAVKFQGFLNDASMQGKKSKYFSRDKNGMRAPEILNSANIYLETNMSSNSIRNMLVKILRKYNIRTNDYVVYFRADYSGLHE